jgi:single-strand DNA-binding protein
MSDLNRVLLTGRLTADPELRYTQSGRAVARLRIAVNRQWQNPETGVREEDTTFVTVVVWGKQAENCAAHLQKGRLVAVDGRLSIRDFETKDGEKRRVAEVIAQSVHFLGPKAQSAEFGTEPQVDIPEPPPEEEVPF